MAKFLCMLLIIISIIPALSAARVAAESSPEITTSLLSDLNSRDDGIQASAVEKLGSIGDAGAVTILMELVGRKEENWKIRIRAIHFLGQIGDERAADLLLNVFFNPFLNEECPAIKWTTTLALGNFRNDPRIIEALTGALKSNSLLIREAAIQSLGNIGASQAVPLLIPALDDSSFAIKHSAIIALEKIADSEAIPYLKKVADTTDDAFLKGEALSALKILKRPDNFPHD